MAIKDIQSMLQPRAVIAATISADGTTDGVTLDTADFELGLMFVLNVSAYTDGTYELQLFEDDNSDMSTETQIVAPKILPTDGPSVISVSAQIVTGAILPTIGAYSNKRYVRAKIVATGTTAGATLQVTAIQAGELMPVETA